MQTAIPTTPSRSDRLIVFTRYPLAGKAKTRLIPAIGAEAAAVLQRQMTEHTLRQAWIWQMGVENAAGSVTVWFARSEASEAIDRQRLQDWLGTQWCYQPQAAGDLGERLIQAIQSAFAAGMQRVVTIGTDCPGLDASRMGQAFAALNRADVVLGPAIDGGYYLIGLRRLVPELFQGIAWSTETVLQQTVAIADRLGLSVAYLEPLADVDRPEDLAVWRSVQQTRPLLSIIIPVLNEESRIVEVVRSIWQQSSEEQPDAISPPQKPEIIIVDGGSQDETVARSIELGVAVLHTSAGRAAQMNAGATAAAGDILLFLHADTQLPPQFLPLIQQTLAQPGIVAGAFELQIDGPQPGLRWIERGVKWRSRLFQLPYGDQAIFVKTAVFQQTGGFAELPIMEDFEWVCRLRRCGKIALAPAAVLTSGRRWQRLGVWRTTWINQLVIAAYFLGISPDWIARFYRGGGIKGQGSRGRGE